ncbi:MAG: glycosyltransferase 87 family protein [Candidatus Acidiferrales bacterium]
MLTSERRPAHHANKLPRGQAAAALLLLVALEAIFLLIARLHDLSTHVVGFIVLALAAGIVYFVALYALEHLGDSRAGFFLVLLGALAFRLTLLPLAPTLSTDLYRYRWDGQVQAAGWNPYSMRPDDPRLATLRAASGAGTAAQNAWQVMPAHELPTVYPPLLELVFRATWRVLPGPVGFKLPFVLADLAVVGMLGFWVRNTGQRIARLAIYAWNPLVIIEFAGSGHNDSLAVAAMVAGILIIRRRPIVSTMALAAGAMAKFFPATLLPMWIVRAGWPRRARGWMAAAVAAAVGLACAWPYRAAASDFLRTMRAYYLPAWQNNNASLYSVLRWLSGSHEFAVMAGRLVVVCLALWFAARQLSAGPARRVEPERAAFLVVGAILLFAPNGYPWYFTWIVPLLCFFPNTAWLLLTVLLCLSYNVLIPYGILGEWRFSPELQWLMYGPFFALLLAQAFLPRRNARNAAGVFGATGDL